MTSLAVVAVTAYFGVASAGNVAVCPGEGARYGDHKCNHDPTHRVCAQLLDSVGQPLSWGRGGNFWQITHQTAFQWDADIRANHGDSWCICEWATAHLIEAVGCENVHLHCEATDVAYVLSQYTDGGVDLEPAKECIKQKCPGIINAVDAELPQITSASQVNSGSLGASAWSAMFVMGAVAAAAFIAKRSRSRAGLEEGLTATSSNTGLDPEDIE